MAREEIIAGLDLGTCTIKCVVGVGHPDGQVDVIGTGTHPANGLRGGRVYNRDEAKTSIRKAIEEAEMMAGCDLQDVVLGQSTQTSHGFNSHGLARIHNGEVASRDIDACIDTALAVRLPDDTKILHVVPQEYIIDGERGISRPQGMHGVRLEVDAHVVTASASSADELESCCRDAGLRVIDVILAPLAAAQSLLSREARELGVVMVDIGYSTTDITVFAGGAIIHSAVLPVGGEHVTADVRDCLHVPTVEAERVIHSHGSALSAAVGSHEEVELAGAGGRRPCTIRRSLLCEIIEARMTEILTLVHDELKLAGFEDGLPGGVVMTGGMSNVAGICELAEQVTDMPTTLGEPKGVTGLVDVVRNPRFATGTGLLVSAARRNEREWLTPAQGRKPAKSRHVWRRILGWFPGAAGAR